MLKPLIVIIGIFLVTLNPSISYAEHSVGFAAGSTTGFGVTYRYLPDPESNNNLGWQVTGLPVITKHVGVISAGVTGIYLLHRGNAGLVYGSLGVGTIYRWDNCGDELEDLTCKESRWGVGFGPGVGFEFRLIENFAFAIDVPLAVIFADGGFEGIYPIPNGSLVYYW